ncbi:MAG: hypothetical protein JRN37_09910 [Nitrososphaerota archaeon]|jgi:hypothetical protein|nr:hypothetical protein [Nitrososphaerota archaeon]MDG7039444.1 hypothetical protein [Nitrososphaerota archaeon]
MNPKDQINNLKAELAAKDKEIAELKEKLKYATFFVSEEIIGTTALNNE